MLGRRRGLVTGGKVGPGADRTACVDKARLQLPVPLLQILQFLLRVRDSLLCSLSSLLRRTGR